MTARTNGWQVDTHANYRRNEEAAGSEAQAVLQDMSDMRV